MARGAWKNRRLERLSKNKFWADVDEAMSGKIKSGKTLEIVEKFMLLPKDDQDVIMRNCLRLCHNTLLAPLQALEVVHQIGARGL